MDRLKVPRQKRATSDPRKGDTPDAPATSGKGTDMVGRLTAAAERARNVIRSGRRSSDGTHAIAETSFAEISTVVDEMTAISEHLQEENDRLTNDLSTTEAALRRYRDLFHLAPAGQLVTDADGMILEANHASAALLDFGDDGLEGHSVTLFLRDGQNAATVAAQLGQLNLGHEIQGWEVNVQPKERTPFPASVNVSPALDPEGQIVGFQWQLYDITDRKRVEDALAFKANHDHLTGLPNRSMFQELLGLALARARRRDLAVAVLYLDLDNFKLVNDTLGHPAGDELLRQVAARISEVSRETDLVARLGGDEFAILLSDLGPTEMFGGPANPDRVVLTLRWVASRIQECFRTAFTLSGTETFASASIGISMFPSDAEDAEALLEHADAAMYRSKKAGPGGTAAFSGRMANEKMTSFSLRLRAAVDEQRWLLQYQPIVDLSDTRVVGVEALLRWRRKDGSLIPPGEFIHLAEEMGLIETIGEWVFEAVARQYRAWSRVGFEVDVSFNVSAHQLWDPLFGRRLLSVLESEEVPPRRIVMEITESAAMGDPDRRLEVLWELHARGVRLAIDDFGTGYSSLTRLKHLPVDILKIDRSFIRDLPDGVSEPTIAAATIQLALNLGIVPLGEGIETAGQRDYLAAHGCALGQGYLFGAPMSPDEVVPNANAEQAPVTSNGSSASALARGVTLGRHAGD
jgi:diguanylate cyclase (GGDEF)-like protein/PAS domain S-box-containing protein